MHNKIIFLFFIFISFLTAFSNNLSQKILYQVEGSDRISSLHQLSNGWILGGIGLSDRMAQGSEATFVLSKDKGVTWKEIWVPVATDMKTYMIQSNKNIVIAVRGDRGQPQVLRSEDYGETWKVALSSSQIKSISGSPGPLYSVVFHKYQKKFYVFPSNAVIEGDSEGLNWKKSSLVLPDLPRNAYYLDETDDMIIPCYGSSNPGFYVYRKGAKSISKTLSGPKLSAYGYFGNGVMVASGYSNIKGNDYTITKAQRKNNKLTLYLSSFSSEISVGSVISYSVPLSNTFSNYNNTNIPIVKVDSSSKSLTINQYGPDTDLIKMPSSSTLYTGTGKNTIYRSVDYGNSWKAVSEFVGCNHQGYIEFARAFPILGKGVGYLSIAGHEEEKNWQGVGDILKTEDYGISWSKTDEIKGIKDRRLNAIYCCITLDDGRLMCGGQYGRLIMTLN